MKKKCLLLSLAPMQGGSAALGLMSGQSTTTEMTVYPTTSVFVFPNAVPVQTPSVIRPRVRFAG